MGTLHNIVSSLCFLCVLLVIITYGNDIDNENNGIKGRKGHHSKTGRRVDGSERSDCTCAPCMTGKFCNESVESNDPKFNQRFTFVEVTQKHLIDGLPLSYNQTTHHHDRMCQCEVFEYSITTVENENDDNPSEMFIIDRVTGEIRLNKNRAQTFTADDMYRLEVSSRNRKTGSSDSTKLTVVLSQPSETDRMYGFDQGDKNGFFDHESHSRQKRAAVPTETTFSVVRTDLGDTNVEVGERVIHELSITFPSGPVDMQVEIFAPDSTYNIMVLCDVEILSVGLDLSPAGLISTDINYMAKPGYSNLTRADWVAMDFGTVTGGSTSAERNTIVIKYEAFVVENSAPDGQYWVSVGAMFLGEEFIWVGQSSVDTVSSTSNTFEEPVINVTMPSSLALGSSNFIGIDIYLPYPVRDYVVKIFPPADTVGLMSMCDLKFVEAGDNFKCGNDWDAVIPRCMKNTQGIGNTIAEVDLGRLTNKGSRDISMVVSDNLIALEGIVHLYKDPGLSYVGQTLSLGLAVEIDTSTVLIANADFIVDSEVTTAIMLTEPELVGTPSTSLNLNLDNAVMFEPFDVTYTVRVPIPTTPGVSSHYTVEILALMNGQTPEFSVCQFKVISVGSGLNCLLPEDLETVYSSRSGGIYQESDKATIDLGHVINLKNSSSPDDEIVIQAKLMPLNYSSSVGSTSSITFGMLVASQSVTLAVVNFTIGSERQYTEVTNVTKPIFNMAFYDGNPNVVVGGSTKVNVDMVTSPSVTYNEVTTEFLMPQLADNYAYFHICKVEIESAGQNLPCTNADWYNTGFTYISTFGDYINDGAKLSMNSVCNIQNVADTNEDKAVFAVYLKVLDRPELQTGSSENVAVGLSFSNYDLWVGNLQLNPQRNPSAINGPTGNSYIFTSQVSGFGVIPQGLTKVYKMLIKIPRGEVADLALVVTADDSNLQICSVQVKRAGDNLPCVADEVATRINGPGMISLDFSLGRIQNYGNPSSGNMTANSYFDDDSMELEYIVRANPAAPQGTYGFNTKVYFDTNRLSSSTTTFDDFEVQEGTAGIDETITDPVTIDASIGEITGNDNTTSIVEGESKKILVSIVIPEGSLYRVRVKINIPSATVGKLEICEAVILSVGDNLPCISKTMEAEIRSTINGNYNDEAEFDLGHVCSNVLRPGDVVANTVVFEAYVRLVPNGSTVIGDALNVTATLTVFSTADITITSATFIVDDGSTFTDRHMVISGVPNKTLVSIDEIGAIVMSIAETRTIRANLSIPRNSVSRLLFDVELPVTDSACLTVSAVRVIGSPGRNVLCVEGYDNVKNVVYHTQFESALNTTEMNYAYMDLGIVTNTGLSYRWDTFADGDDDVVVEFDIQMADCKDNTDGAVHQLSIGEKISEHVVIYDHDVQVSRNGEELVEFEHDLMVDYAQSSSTVIYLNGTVYHSSNSTAGGRNTSVFIFLPFYQVAPTSIVFSGTTGCNVNADPMKPSLLEIFCESFFFTDVLTYMAVVQLNSSAVLPTGFSTDPSYAFSMIGSDFNILSQYYNTTSWFPYYVDELQTISYPLTVPSNPVVCGTSVGVESTGVVLDCQFESSTDNSASPAYGARYGASSAWVSFIRDGEWAKNRYVGVYFGHLHTFTSVLIKNDVGNRDMATEFEISYTNDGTSFFGAENVNLGLSPNIEETRSLSGTVARGVRLTITNDTSNLVKPQVGIQFKLFGCKQATDPDGISSTDACNVLSGTPIPTDFYTRSFIGLSASEAYFCDRDITTKKRRGKCYFSVDGGSKWNRVAGSVGSLIGYESSAYEIYAYNNDQSTLMMIDALTHTVVTVAQSRLDVAKQAVGWMDAIAVPETDDISINQPGPTANYTMNDVGATYNGIFMSGVQKVAW